LLGGCQTPLCNPASAILTQSKRFPLVWDELPLHLPTWAALLPKTYDARDLARHGISADSVVFKPAFGRVGDMIRIPGLTTGKEADRIHRAVRRDPGSWIAQQCFSAVPLATQTGNVFPCIGVYTLDGAVIGAYGRVARRPLVDHLAQDAAVLIAQPTAAPCAHQPAYNDSNRTLQPVGA
jgi:glutathionylspermidine synthase